MLLKQRINDHLADLCRAGPFYECSFDQETGYITIDETTNVPPSGISISEVDSNFVPARRMRREFQVDRASWEWEVRLNFVSRTIAFEAFENAVTDGPILIPEDDGRSLLAVLQRTEYNPPPQSSPSGGSSAVFTFQILPESLRK